MTFHLVSSTICNYLTWWNVGDCGARWDDVLPGVVSTPPLRSSRAHHATTLAYRATMARSHAAWYPPLTTMPARLYGPLVSWLC